VADRLLTADDVAELLFVPVVVGAGVRAEWCDAWAGPSGSSARPWRSGSRAVGSPAGRSV
jgi:hypothetical protein